MRINPNRKVHKLKRDPYKVLTKLALILAVCVAVGVGIFYLCSKAVERDYVIKRDQIDRMNAENEVEFNTRSTSCGRARTALSPTPSPAIPLKRISLRGKRRWTARSGGWRTRARPVWKTSPPLP